MTFPLLDSGNSKRHFYWSNTEVNPWREEDEYVSTYRLQPFAPDKGPIEAEGSSRSLLNFRSISRVARPCLALYLAVDEQARLSVDKAP
jgi:hypothetical protein